MRDPGTDVDLWVIRVEEQSAELSNLMDLLDPVESARCSRFCHDRLKQHFTVTHGCLRKLLATYLDVRPKEIQYRSGSRDKPAIAFPETSLCFNLAHSAEVAVVGIARCEIGVDVERVRPIQEMMGIAQQFFSSQETSYLEQVPRSERAATFYRIWTRKEAFVKCLGEGLAFALDSFGVSIGNDARVVEIGGDSEAAANWQLHTYDPKPGYVGAIAYRGTRRKLQAYQWT